MINEKLIKYNIFVHLHHSTELQIEKNGRQICIQVRMHAGLFTSGCTKWRQKDNGNDHFHQNFNYKLDFQGLYHPKR